MKKSITSVLLLAAVLVTGSAIADRAAATGAREVFVDRARVLEVVPVFREHRDTPRNGDTHRAKSIDVHVTKSGVKLSSEHRYDNGHQPREHREVTGYRVKYRFRDNRYWTMMDRRPGRYIDIRVKITPIG